MSTMTTNASHGPPSGHPAKAKARPSALLPHIDDLLAIPDDIDPNQSIKRLLTMTETSLRQSEVSRNFDRPALALKDYVRASIIAVQVIGNHKDYLALKDPDSEPGRLHNALLKRIFDQSDVFDDIKRGIIQDNRRTGVQPTVRRSMPSRGPATPPLPVNGQAPRTNGRPLPPALGAQAKKKPAVLPKPPSLLGNVIVPAPPNNDLTARFVNLRGPQPSPGQDPRIKTYPIPTQRPAGPRQMPNSPELDADSDAAASALPKVPDAIYTPARGSVSGEATRLPTGNPRGPFSRTGSSTSISNTFQRQNNEFIPSAPTSAVPKGESFELPPEGSITAQQLYQVFKAKWSVLLIDIRCRQDFDQGHIIASSVICIEPSVLLRENMSSDDISESMVLSPNPEQALFERRGSYDLVVFYDQDSQRVAQTPKNSDELAVVSLHRALEQLSYGRPLKRSPRILRGGLDAWKDLMGAGSLQSTNPLTSTSFSTPLKQKRNGFIQKRGQKFVVTSLQSADVKAWENTLERDAHQAATRPSFPRTGEEFLRSSPVGAQQQSMMAPAATQERQQPGFGSLAQLPAPPARPRAAVQRLSHNGLSKGDDGSELFGESAAPPSQRTAARSKRTSEHGSGAVSKPCTGLNNPGNWCYANSMLQSLLASPGFGRELAESEWSHKYAVPRKNGEKIDPPQLMIRILSNMFHWMSTGTFETMKAQTLMDYSRQLCKSNASDLQFGGSAQQDAQEFMSFVMDQLHDETNPRRNHTVNAAQPPTSGQGLAQSAMQYWARHSEFNQSIVDRYWRGIEVSSVQCTKCNSSSHTFTPFGLIAVPVSLDRDMTLAEAFSAYVAGNQLDDFSCDPCKANTRATQSISLARMPPLLCLSFRRFIYRGNSPFKITTAITWDFDDFDFSPYVLDASGQEPAAPDRAFTGPFRYECYAVVVHAGERLNTGHYYAFVRDQGARDPHAWYRCNDNVVTSVRIGSGDAGDVQDDVFRSAANHVPYLVFFRRKGA